MHDPSLLDLFKCDRGRIVSEESIEIFDLGVEMVSNFDDAKPSSDETIGSFALSGWAWWSMCGSGSARVPGGIIVKCEINSAGAELGHTGCE